MNGTRTVRRVSGISTLWHRGEKFYTCHINGQYHKLPETRENYAALSRLVIAARKHNAALRRAHRAVDAAAQMGALIQLAAHWDIPGHWNEHATGTAQRLHDFVDGQEEGAKLASWPGAL